MRLCFCGLPVFGTDKKTRIGYCRSHQYKRTDLDTRTPVQKALARLKEGGLVNDDGGLRLAPAKTYNGNQALDRWFEDRKLELTGKCKHCGGKTWTPEDDLRRTEAAEEGVYKNTGKFYKHCICHILPKAHFPSVATHPDNWIELCFWKNNCHANFDNFTLDITELNCFDEVIEKFIAMYPDIDPKERRRIPATLLSYIET